MDKSNEHYNKMINTKIPKLIIKLGIPTTISLLITNIYNLVDSYFVGSLGESQQGALGIIFVLQLIIQGFAFMLGNGAGVFIGTSLAKKNKIEASKYVSTSFFLGLFISIFFLIVGLIFLEQICLLLGSTQTILPYAKDYSFWILMAAPFFVTSLILNNNLRYEGQAFFAMIGLTTGALLNMLGDYIFIRVFNLGVYGAGLSTAISQCVSFFILFYYYRKNAQSIISIKYATFKAGFIFKICKVGFPSLLRQSFNAVTSGVINNLAKPFGDAAIAAISVVNKYVSLVFCLGLGIGQGLQPVSSFNFQVKRYDRVKHAILFTLIVSTVVIGTISIASFFLADKIVWLFQKNDEVITIGTIYLKFACLSLWTLPVSLILNMVYQSIRKPLHSSFFALIRSGMIQLPVVIVLVSTLNLKGLQMNTAVADYIILFLNIPFLVKFIFFDLKKLQNEQIASTIKLQ